MVRKICDRVAVMENGKVVEEGDAAERLYPSAAADYAAVCPPGEPVRRGRDLNTELANDLEGTVIRLTFTGHSTHKPIVGELTLRYGLPFNILHGKK